MTQLHIAERHMQARYQHAQQLYDTGQFAELADLAVHSVNVGAQVWVGTDANEWETIGRMRGVANCIAMLSGRAGIITKATGFFAHVPN